MNSVNDIRNEFLGFFEKQGHQQVESASLVPRNDPTLMFTNAGMVQFKNVFTGVETRPYNRATTSQKCVRAGGKHNDLENVGYTARHHTFFEMLGNFSFGDYFKEEAISYAWELISKNFAMPKDKLLITVHSSDEEAATLWKKIAGFSDDRIIRIPTDDNFWSMGSTGPCGPCSEIFYDQGEALEGGPPGSPDEDGDRFLEFWNLVFMQYEKMEDGTRVELPKPSIDTGMGLERMAALIQGKVSNYDIDLFSDIIEHSAELTGISHEGEHAPSHRVIADHLRASAFLMADGVMPSNEGRGYVLRRIMRRGMRHAHLLGATEPLMYKLLPTLINKMSEAYPELCRAETLTSETLRLEEERFKTTLDRGLKLLEEETSKINDNILPGDVAFKLYDTFGFPLDLTQDALKAQGIGVDTDGFKACMEEQKTKARAAWVGSGDVADEKIWFDILDEHGPTEFLGYNSENAEAQVLAIVKDGKRVDMIKAGEEGILITNQTPFYGESGGQVGDQGLLNSPDESALTVTDTKKQAGVLFTHHVTCTKGAVKISDALVMSVDHQRRSAIRANHSATHLLHEALRVVLGEHVSQKGSLQDEKRTRFDVSHPKGITPDELRQVEEIINNEIQAGSPVETRIMPLEEARETGAAALFGEKYDDEVRVVMMGTQDKSMNKAFSVELCGGTHVKNTSEIGRFKIISESSLSSGVRRIEAMTGERASAYEQNKTDEVQALHDKLLTENKALRKALSGEADELNLPNDLLEARTVLEKDNKSLQKKISEERRKDAISDNDANSSDRLKDIGGIPFSGRVLEGFSPKDLKPMADDLKKQLGSAIIVLIATNEGKASIVVGVTNDLTDRVNAVDLVKVGSEALGGKGGGGRPDMAQAGGPDAHAANDALHSIERAIEKELA